MKTFKCVMYVKVNQAGKTNKFARRNVSLYKGLSINMPFCIFNDIVFGTYPILSIYTAG